MQDKLTIGAVARASGVPVKTIRFYEAAGIIPAPERTEAGYRLYTRTDLRRLHLVRRLRLLDLPLPEVKRVVAQAFASSCDAYALQVLDLLDHQRAELDRRIAELQTLRAELEAVAAHVRQVVTAAPTGLTVATCARCPLIDDASGEESFCECVTVASPTDTDALITAPRVASGVLPMNKPRWLPRDALEVLACDTSARPPHAPTPADLAPALRGRRRERDSLVIEFDPVAADTVTAYAAAEQRCCAGIGWEVERGATVTLRVRATPAQLDVLALMWSDDGVVHSARRPDQT